MATPQEKLAQSLEVLKAIQDKDRRFVFNKNTRKVLILNEDYSDLIKEIEITEDVFTSTLPLREKTSVKLCSLLSVVLMMISDSLR